MFYKKINLPLLPFACLVLAGTGKCSDSNQAPVSSFSDDKENNSGDNKVKGNKPAFLLSSCKALGSISSMEGAKTDFLLQYKGDISNIDPQEEGQVAFIGCSADAPLSVASPIVTIAMNDKDKVEKFLWQDEGDFIYWMPVSKVGIGRREWIIRVEEEAYKKLTSKKYAIHMLYAPSGASAESSLVSTTPLQMDITDKDASPPNFENIGLEAVAPTEKQLDDSSGWSLKGKISESFVNNAAKVGFILVKEGSDHNKLVQQVMASENEWPTEQATSFSNDDMIIVPATFRNEEPRIRVDFPNREVLMEGGEYKILCYFIKNKDDAHYYLSEISNDPITFTGSSHGLKVADLKLSREQVSGQVKNLKLSGGATEYFVDGQAEPVPSDRQSCVAFIKKDFIWRGSTLESLFQKLLESNSNVSITDDQTILLIGDVNKPLEQSGIEFFSSAEAYYYFSCLFSTEDNKLKFYAKKQQLSIEEKDIEKAQPKPQPKPQAPKQDELKITLEGKAANLTFTKTSWFKQAKPNLTRPVVKLEPSGFDKNKIEHRGFVIARDGGLSNNTNMNDHNSIINDFIKDKDKDKDKVSYHTKNNDNKFLIFQENLTQEGTLQDTLYDAYNNYEEEGYKSLDISYWAQYEGKIIWRKPVSIPIVWEKK